MRAGMLAFYERFSAGDPDPVAAGLANVAGVSVIGTGPEEGHGSRDERSAEEAIQPPS